MHIVQKNIIKLDKPVPLTEDGSNVALIHKQNNLASNKISTDGFSYENSITDSVGYHQGNGNILNKLSQRNARQAIIVGVNDCGRKLAKAIMKQSSHKLEFQGYFDERSIKRLKLDPEDRLLGNFSDLQLYVNKNKIHVIFFAMPLLAQPRIQSILEELRNTTASIYFLPETTIGSVIRPQLKFINNIPLFAIRESPFTGINNTVKRFCDIVFSTTLLFFLSPILLIIALCIKFTSPGPVIYSQRRYGLDGNCFTMYKFRTMTVCEEDNNITQVTKNDPRVTAIGGFLRKTSLDELPQLLNVLHGTMSIVGPRPHAIAHNELYRKLISGYMLRHKVKPGITGWAQVNGLRGETEELGKMEARVKYDIEYIQKWSLGLDFLIILRTILIIFKDNNAY
jgi:putative colanic acid biosysnthesis UDP-glucose lipid carrier transferase